ncbi:MAG: hypothetical protein U0574_07525 [Phycisphaerales bacterium]
MQLVQQLPAGATADPSFGFRVAVSGDVAIVGANSLDYPNAMNGGAAMVYRRIEGSWIQDFMAVPDVPGISQMGDSVAVSVSRAGTHAVVGAPIDGDPNAQIGAAYFLSWDGSAWTQAKAHASDPRPQAAFGTTVAMNGDVAAVTASNGGDAGYSSGAVYVFRWSGTAWVEEQKLIPSDAQAGDEFGSAVAIDGNTIAIGAQDDDDASPHAGAAYVFRWNGASWVEAQKLHPWDASAPGALFGRAIAIRGDLLAVSAPNGGQPFAYVFRLVDGAWVPEAKLESPVAPQGGGFGVSVATDGSVVLVGTGASAYAFAWNGVYWPEGQPFPEPGGPQAGPSGSALAVDGDTVIVNGGESGVGAAYIYSLNCPDPLPGDLNSNGQVNGSDLGILLGFWGPCSGLCLGDIDGNGIVNGADLGLLLANWTG